MAQRQAEASGLRVIVDRWMPGVSLAQNYERSWFSNDLAAGLSLTALLVPQGMAYAELAGLPAVTGLYTTVVALIAYALLGPSPVLVLGPDSALGPLIFAAVAAVVVVADDPGAAVAAAGMLALFMGLISAASGMTGLGRIAELLSKPARIGYLNGLAVVIFVNQLPKLFGFSDDADGLLSEAKAFVQGLLDGDAEPAAALIGIGVIVIILGLRRIAPQVPGVLIATIAAIAAVALLDLAREIPVVGSLPSGFPSPSLPSAGFDQLPSLFAAAAGIAFVSLADTMALSRSLAAERGEEVDPDDELVALGGANIAAAFFQGFPVERVLVEDLRGGVGPSPDPGHRSRRRDRHPDRVGVGKWVAEEHALVRVGGDRDHGGNRPARPVGDEVALEGPALRVRARRRGVPRRGPGRRARGHRGRGVAVTRQLHPAGVAPT